MATTFDSFTFTYNNTGPRYEFAYSLTTTSSNWKVSAYINSTNVGFEGDTLSGTIFVQEAIDPKYFTQGYPISAYLNFQGDDVVDSATVYGVFQRATDQFNISINGNTKYVYAFTNLNSNRIKSIIFPPISQSPFCTFYFKYLGQVTPASICPYMSNVSYPIATSQFTTTDSTYSGIFDSKFAGAYQNVVFEPTYSNSCFGIFNNGSNWFYSSIYNAASLTLTFGSSSETTGALVDASNSQILYHQYTSQSTIVMCNSPPTLFPKFICFRNPPNVAEPIVTVRIFAPPAEMIDTTTPDLGSAYVSFNLNAGQQRTIGFYYSETAKGYYILTNFDSTGLTATSNLTGFTTLSNTFGAIYDQDKNVKLTLPIQKYGYAKINTIGFFEGVSQTPRTITVTAPSASDVIIIHTGPTEMVNLGNSGANIAYTFASFYNGATSNSVSIPLYNSSF